MICIYSIANFHYCDCVSFYNYKIRKNQLEMESPFTFDPANRRVVLNTRQSKYVYPAGGALYVCSLYLYARRFLRVERNIVAAGAFAAASLPASYAYSRFFLGSPQIEAALMNNAHEAGLRQQE